MKTWDNNCKRTKGCIMLALKLPVLTRREISSLLLRISMGARAWWDVSKGLNSLLKIKWMICTIRWCRRICRFQISSKWKIINPRHKSRGRLANCISRNMTQSLLGVHLTLVWAELTSSAPLLKALSKCKTWRLNFQRTDVINKIIRPEIKNCAKNPSHHLLIVHNHSKWRDLMLTYSPLSIRKTLLWAGSRPLPRRVKRLPNNRAMVALATNFGRDRRIKFKEN